MNTFTVSSIHRFPRYCTPKAREIVLNILNGSKTPLSTKDIYKLAVDPARVSNTPPPHSDEAIRSMSYLKTVVLRDLAAESRVEKIRTKGAFTAWLWQLKHGPRASQAKPTATATTAVTAPPSDSTGLTPAAVGVGEDWSHLNKRRQRARKRKVERDLKRFEEVQKMRARAAE